MRRFAPILLGILTLLAVAFVCFVALHWVKSQRGMQEQLTARDVIYEQLRAIVMNQGVLKMAARFGSRPGNAELAHCILPTDPSPCIVTSSAAQTAFAIPQSRDEGAALLVGDTERPAAYSAKGALGCDGGAEDCPGWQAIAWFWADCAGGAPECELASRVHVRYQVQGVGKLAAQASNPPAGAFDADPEAFSFAVDFEPEGTP